MSPEHGVIGTDRVEAFSDAVIAIAITLLVLEVRPPHPEPGQSLLAAVLAQWPAYMSFLSSFLIIGIIWIVHHNMFRLIARIDHPLLLVNLALLAFVAFIPFPTALVADNLAEGSRGQVAAGVYSSVFIGKAIVFNLLWRHAARHRRLLHEWVPEKVVRGTSRWFALAPVFPAVSLGLAFINGVLSVLVYLALVMTYVLPGERVSRALGSYCLRRARELAATARESGKPGQEPSSP